jgi:hypothetical protein
MKALLFVSTFLIVFFGFSQLEIEKGNIYRWKRIFNNEVNSSFFQSLSKAEKNNDFLGVLYQKVEGNELSLYFDTLAIGNFGNWKKIPEVRYYINPNSPETFFTFYVLDYLKVQEKSIEPKKNENGNPLTYFLSDGTESYQFEYVVRPMEVKDIQYIDLLEIGKLNKKTKKIDFSCMALGFQLPHSQSTIWMKYEEIQNVLGSAVDFVFLDMLEKKIFSAYQYRQEGYQADIDQSETSRKRIRVRKDAETSCLFSKEFMDTVASLINNGELNLFFNYRKEPWDYSWELSNFDLPLMDTSAPLKVSKGDYKILARKGPIDISKFGDTLFELNAFGDSSIVYEPDVYLYYNLSEISEIRIDLKYAKTPNFPKVYELESLVFVKDSKECQRELFLIDLAHLLKMEDRFKNEPWFEFLKDQRFSGEQFFQSR